MTRRLLNLYQRKRIININLNVIAAGLLAIACTKVVMWLAAHLFHGAPPLFFTIVALVCDMFFDVAIYYALHWLANHWRPRWARKPDSPKPPPFIKDATLIQFERALLAPVYYILAGVLMQLLQADLGWKPGWAMAAAFTTGLLATRVLHTAMGLYTGSFRDLHKRKPRPGVCPTCHGPVAEMAPMSCPRCDRPEQRPPESPAADLPG
jgi:uncharacterized paraquat-inducible protein A